MTTDSDVLLALADGPLHFFRDWGQTEVPRYGAGVYTVWDEGGHLVYVGMSGKSIATDTLQRATPHGIFTRLASHASGRRSGDLFCVYVADRLVLPRLTSREISDISRGATSLDGLLRRFIRDHLAYRYVILPNGTTAFQIESLVKTGILGEVPLLNLVFERNRQAGEDDHDDRGDADDDGAGSPVRTNPSPDAGAGSAALPEPHEPDSEA